MEVVTNFEITKKAHSAKREYRHDRFGRATRMLDKLSYKLLDIDIITSYRLLLDLRESSKKYRLITKGFPRIMVSRKISVPTYTYGCNISSENICEEHAILSKKYTISRYKK